jgi:hypothetical protein
MALTLMQYAVIRHGATVTQAEHRALPVNNGWLDCYKAT